MKPIIYQVIATIFVITGVVSLFWVISDIWIYQHPDWMAPYFMRVAATVVGIVLSIMTFGRVVTDWDE